MKRIARLLCLLLLFPLAAAAERPAIFDQIQAALQSRDAEAYLNLISSDPALQKLERKFMADFLSFETVNTILDLVKAEDNQLKVQVLMQASSEVRYELWSITTGIENGRTVILSRDVLSSLDGLYRLRMSDTAYAVRDVQFTHFDATIRLQNGQLFPIYAGDQIAGALFIGQGSFLFAPTDPVEQQQLTLFCKKPRLETPLQHFYIRASAEALNAYFKSALSGTSASNPALYQKAQEITRESDRSAFAVRLPISEELWFPRVQSGDLYSEIKTDFGTLVYQFAPNEQEDILLAQKEPDRIVSLYSSQGRDTPAGDGDDFRVLSYQMNLRYDPSSQYLSGSSEMLLSPLLPTSSIVFKLNPSLRVSAIESSQGDLLYFQEKTTNNLHVILNELVDEGAQVRLRLRYEGAISPDKGRAETQTSRNTPDKDTDFYIPPTFLYSNQALWYPQLLSKPYSPVDTTIEVPTGFAAVTNGTLQKVERHKDSTVYSYSCDLPAKYFSLLVGRLRGDLTQESLVPIRVFYYEIDRSAAMKQAALADSILRYYTDYFGRYPYRNLNIALRPATEPGGHAPAGVIIANRVYSYMRMRFEPDPLWIPEYPDFLVAHEIAHQWWGQGIGWRTYRDQWLSEGFAQFAAAEYIRSVHGDRAWLKLADEFQDWVRNKTSAGPIVLGMRLGHLNNDPRAFSAIMYNKGAYVLNMLKNWMGPDNFKASLQEFYSLYQFKRTSIHDFIKVAQRHSTEDLAPFFEQWLYDWTIPEVTWSWKAGGSSEEPSVVLRFQQPADHTFRLKIPVEMQDAKGQAYSVEAIVDKPDTQIEVVLPFVPARVVVDPLRENLMQLENRQNP